MMSKELNTQIGKNIRYKRLCYDMSLEELAQLIGVTPGYMGLIERGQRGTTVKHLYDITKIFNVSIDDLLNGVDKTPYNPLKDKLNAYIPFMNDDDCRHILDVCKFLKTKNENSAIKLGTE